MPGVYTALRRDADAVETALALNKDYPDDPEILYQTGRIYGNFTYLTMEKLRDKTHHIGFDTNAVRRMNGIPSLGIKSQLLENSYVRSQAAPKIKKRRSGRHLIKFNKRLYGLGELVSSKSGLMTINRIGRLERRLAASLTRVPLENM